MFASITDSSSYQDVEIQQVQSNYQVTVERDGENMSKISDGTYEQERIFA